MAICSNLCLTTYNSEDLPVGDDKDEQRYDELPDEREYTVALNSQNVYGLCIQ